MAYRYGRFDAGRQQTGRRRAVRRDFQKIRNPVRPSGQTGVWVGGRRADPLPRLDTAGSFPTETKLAFLGKSHRLAPSGLFLSTKRERPKRMYRSMRRSDITSGTLPVFSATNSI